MLPPGAARLDGDAAQDGEPREGDGRDDRDDDGQTHSGEHWNSRSSSGPGEHILVFEVEQAVFQGGPEAFRQLDSR